MPGSSREYDPTEAEDESTEAELDRDRIMARFPGRTTDGTLHHAILIVVAEVDRLRGAVEGRKRAEDE